MSTLPTIALSRMSKIDQLKMHPCCPCPPALFKATRIAAEPPGSLALGPSSYAPAEGQWWEGNPAWDFLSCVGNAVAERFARAAAALADGTASVGLVNTLNKNAALVARAWNSVVDEKGAAENLLKDAVRKKKKEAQGGSLFGFTSCVM